MAYNKNLTAEEREKKREENQEKIKKAMEKIEAGVQDVFSSEKFAQYLSFMSKFHNYSLNNTILIMMQKPDASLVAGYNKWQTDFKRHVNAGEKGIAILAPIPYSKTKLVDKKDEFGEVIIDPKTGKPEKEEKEVKYLSYKLVNVFDVSQTSGEPIPQLTEELKGSDKHARELFSAIREISDCSVSIVSEKTDATLAKGAKGYFSLDRNIIVVKDELSDVHKVKTLLHEYAHSQFHNDKDKVDALFDRQKAEIEAEATAFALSQYFGLDTSDYSFPYVASWSQGKNPEELKEILQNITNKVSEMIEKIEPVFQKRLELSMDKEKTVQIEK